MAGLHQTLKLSPGRHRGPAQGTCAMELASLLGDERFTDHPSRVCAVLAAFLRGYNDATSDALRQELYGLAATVVDSRVKDPAVREERARALFVHTMHAWRSRGRRFALPPHLPAVTAYADIEAAGAYVGRLARRNAALHERTVALVEDLARRGRPETDAPARQHADAPGPVPAPA